MHFDSPEHAGHLTQLRAFVNVDNYPRIWRVGGTLEEMASNCYRSADLKKTTAKHPRTFCGRPRCPRSGDRYEQGAPVPDAFDRVPAGAMSGF